MEIKGAPTQQQIKVLVSSEIASAFRQACVASEVSMATVLTQYMAEYAKSPLKPSAVYATDYSTRRRRRASLGKIIAELRRIKAGEEESRDNVPENLQGSETWERADEIISSLEEAIESLECVMVP